MNRASCGLDLRAGHRPNLARGEIHVWHAVAGEPATGRFEPLLDADELARAGRFVFARDRQLFVAARGALRLLAGDYLGVSAASLRFEAGRFGKPRLAEPERGLQFNVSHAGSHALLAFAADREVGVDVERVDDGRDVFGLAPTVFTASERRALGNVPPEERLAMFFRLWTGKEAVLKAAGGGLSIPLQDFSVAPMADGAAVPVTMHSSTLPPLSVQWLSAPEGYQAALAAGAPPWHLRVFHLNERIP